MLTPYMVVAISSSIYCLGLLSTTSSSSDELESISADFLPTAGAIGSRRVHQDAVVLRIN